MRSTRWPWESFHERKHETLRIHSELVQAVVNRDEEEAAAAAHRHTPNVEALRTGAG